MIIINVVVIDDPKKNNKKKNKNTIMTTIIMPGMMNIAIRARDRYPNGPRPGCRGSGRQPRARSGRSRMRPYKGQRV